jgi:signal transduction histidine kinase
MIRSCNAAAREQLAPGCDLTGSRITDYMPQADAARLQRLLAQPGRQDAPVRLNFAPINGVPFTLECWIAVHGEEAVLVGGPALGREQQLQHQLIAMNQELAVLARDRSREARHQRVGREAAERTNRERNAFLSMLAHELRQPLGGALAALGVLRQLNPDPVLERPRGLLQRQLEQITRLVEDLADTARVAGGDVDLRRPPVDIVSSGLPGR